MCGRERREDKKNNQDKIHSAMEKTKAEKEGVCLGLGGGVPSMGEEDLLNMLTRQGLPEKVDHDIWSRT